jgi:CHASE2 domain-containing sensor protein
MGLVGSLWNRELQARLQRIHQCIARQAASGEPSARRSPPTFKRRRVGQIRDTIVAILAEQKNGLRMRDIAVFAAAKLGEPIPPSTIKACLLREAEKPSGAFERISRGRYRLRQADLAK